MFDNRAQISLEVRIMAICLIIDTIDKLMENELTMKKQLYLNYRRDLNLIKLKSCMKLSKK